MCDDKGHEFRTFNISYRSWGQPVNCLLFIAKNTFLFFFSENSQLLFFTVIAISVEYCVYALGTLNFTIFTCIMYRFVTSSTKEISRTEQLSAEIKIVPL